MIALSITDTIVTKERAPEVARQQAQRLVQATTQQEVYKNMLETFQQPQEVVGAYLRNNMYPLIVLKGGNVIGIPEMTFEKRQEYIDLIALINKTLVGKEVKVTLPNFSENKFGSYVGLRSCNDGIPILVKDARQQFNLQEDIGYCSIIVANEITYNGQGLYKEYLK
ncbi:MAG: hypothetical protein NTZ44_01510 [Candidatus Nomurabacteria bacterium]|nr:hypothetical protein [Candidatus Nomurabacteria bacterium]